MADGKDPIDAAIESAESLIASFILREKSERLPEGVEEPDKPTGNDLSHESYWKEKNTGCVNDPEQSLFLHSDQSLMTEGAASLWPNYRTASSQAIFSELGNLSPRQSLHAIVTKVSDSVIPDSPDVDTLLRVVHERDKDIEVAAKLGQLLLHRNEILESDLTRTVEQMTLLEQQLRHSQQVIVKKEELLRLYASEQQEESLECTGSHGSQLQPEWVQLLSEECQELRESNLLLQSEADKLKRETAEVELKEKELVQHCLEQFTEAKRRLAELREATEVKQDEIEKLQGEVKLMSTELCDMQEKWEERQAEMELMKEQLAESMEQNHHLAHGVLELQERNEDVMEMLREAKEENIVLKKAADSNPSSSLGESGQVEHESIVKEIEEVLRREIIAASTLSERPRSPNNYAQQRTMVVMETVRAATLASSRRQKRLKAAVAGPQPNKSLPLATSSPSNHALASANAADHNSLLPAGLPSPVLAKTSPEEVICYRNKTYVPPEKLQIVKPLEGSVTLLKWKLLATPQLGGATSFFSDASRPGVHLKKWKAGGVQDTQPSAHTRVPDLTMATTDITSPEQSNLEELGREEDRVGGGWGREVVQSSADVPSGTTLHKRGRQSPCPAGVTTGLEKKTLTATAHRTTASNSSNMSTSKSLLGQVGSFLGSSWSRLSNTQGDTSTDTISVNRTADHEKLSSAQHGLEESTGLASILDIGS